MSIDPTALWATWPPESSLQPARLAWPVEALSSHPNWTEDGVKTTAVGTLIVGGSGFGGQVMTIRGNHINGIEGFWGYAKTRLARFRGMHPSTFYLHLKECEFRFNHRRQDLYHVLLKLCRENPLS